jgi:hypothetical protein
MTAAGADPLIPFGVSVVPATEQLDRATRSCSGRLIPTPARSRGSPATS